MELTQLISTSYLRNRPMQLFGIRVSTLSGTTFSLFPCVIVVGVFRENPIIGFVIATFIVFITFRSLEYFRQGKFENENLEKFMVKFKSPFRAKDLNKEEVAMAKIKGNDFYLSSGDELIGFQILETNTLSFDTFVTTLLPILPAYSSVKFIRLRRPETKVPLHLKDKTISHAEYFIFVRIPMNISGNALGKRNLKEKILSLENAKMKILSCADIAHVSESIFFPFQSTTGKNPPYFRTDVEIIHGLGKGIWPGKHIASVSLAQLPEKFVSRNFEEIFDSVSDCYGAVCATFQKIEISKIARAYKHHINKKHNKIDDENIYLQTQNDCSPVKLHLGILIHGSENEISNALFNIDTACMSLGDGARPIFGQDLGFLRKALSVYLPGSFPLVPFRTHTVDSIRELLCYLPRPEYSKSEPNSDLIFRTRQNKLFSITQDSKYPVAYISDMGAGKSLLLSLNILSHIKKRHSDQVAGCYIEVGGSFRFLTSHGLADVYFILRNLDDGGISPLQDHPLRAFKSFGPRGVEAAIKWVCVLCGVDEYNKEVQQKCEHIVSKALIKLFFENHEFKLTDFYKTLKTIVLSDVTDVANDEDHIWRTLIKNLERYCNEKRWGHIFCPNETMDFDFENARFVYFSSFESKLEPEGIYKPFFTFAVLISQLYAEKYSSNSNHPSRIQFMIDELHILRQVIPEELYVDLNSVARKEGKIPMFATQNFSHITLDERKWGAIKKYSMIQSIKRLWFYQFPGPESALCHLLGVDEKDPLIAKVREVSHSNLRLKEQGVFAWGYIDEFKNIRQLIVDADKYTLWACTTHPGGIAIREACLNTKLYDYFTTCRLLAENFKNPIPEQSGIPQETIISIVDHVIFSKHNLNTVEGEL